MPAQASAGSIGRPPFSIIAWPPRVIPPPGGERRRPSPPPLTIRAQESRHDLRGIPAPPPSALRGQRRSSASEFDERVHCRQRELRVPDNQHRQSTSTDRLEVAR